MMLAIEVAQSGDCAGRVIVKRSRGTSISLFMDENFSSENSENSGDQEN